MRKCLYDIITYIEFLVCLAILRSERVLMRLVGGFSTTWKQIKNIVTIVVPSQLYLDLSLISWMSRNTGRPSCTYFYIHFPSYVIILFYCTYFIQFCVEYKTIKKLSLSLLIVSTSQFYIYKGQIGIVFGTIVCIRYLWVIGYRVRLRG